MRWKVVLLLVLLAVVSIGAGLSHLRSALIEQGRSQERQQARDDADDLVRKANSAGAQMAEHARAEAQSAREHAAKLQRELRHGRQAQPLVVAVEGLGQPAVQCERPAALASMVERSAAAALGAVPAAGPGASAPAAAPTDAPIVAPGGGLRLSAGAVRLWDSALAGADVPAGACGSADAPATACAAASAYDIQHAWENHIENAARCREDRARHRLLIEFLQRARFTAAAP